MKQDVNFSVDNNRFNYRVGAYISCKDKILLQRSFKCDFYNLVGGRVKMGESTEEAIIREVKEELGLDVENPKLMVVAEMFFSWMDKNVQELLFVYKIDLDEDVCCKLNNAINLDSKDEIIELIDVNDLKNIKCRPELIYDLINLDEDKITHLCFKN